MRGMWRMHGRSWKFGNKKSHDIVVITSTEWIELGLAGSWTYDKLSNDAKELLITSEKYGI